MSDSTTFAPLAYRLLVQSIPEEASEYGIHVPYDLYCPSMKEKLQIGTCNVCNRYWPSEAAMKRHKKVHQKRKEMEVDEHEEENIVETNEERKNESKDENMPVFTNIFDLLKSPFLDEK